MAKFILGLGLLVAACGSSDGGGDAPKLDGLWQLQTANGCVATFGFSGNKWSDSVLCELQSGGLAQEIETGAINKTADTIDFMPQTSSCPPHAHASSAGYSFTSGQLVLRFSNATLIFKSASASGTSNGAAIANGCWDFSQSPALFTPGSVEQL